MSGFRSRPVAGAVAVTVLLTAASEARPVTVPFDFSRHEIGLNVRVHGTPLYMFLDTGASPSAIDTARAKSLGLKIDFANGGEASGQGDDAHAMVYPTSIDGLTVGDRSFPAIEALAADQAAISKAYGRTVDGTLGHSFLAGRAMLIDYAAATIAISGNAAGLARQSATCRTALRLPLKSYKGDTIPIVDMGVGTARLPVSIDTGSNSTVELYKNALDLPEIKAALVEAGSHTVTGNRGEYTVKDYRLNAPIGIGPFVLPAGESVSLTGDEGSAETRLANVGNRLLADMHVKLLLDYRDNRIAFLGDCAK
ncbi:MAG TPA: retropepsin-like aspartic protease [Rhizomicrobium sp.]